MSPTGCLAGVDKQGEPVHRAGYAFIKEQMRQENTLFAVEIPSHYCFRDMGFCDKGIFAIVRRINLFSINDQPLSRLIRSFLK